MLRTQSHVETTEVQGGEYYHFGLARAILSKLKCLRLPVNLTSLTLHFNIDGLPLFKSSTLQFWPILSMLKCDYSKSPFIVGIYCGLTKPEKKINIMIIVFIYIFLSIYIINNDSIDYDCQQIH